MSAERTIEDLVAQRDFLLANTWVKWAPRVEGEGCLVGRRVGPDTLDEKWINDAAAFAILRVLEQSLGDGDEPLVTIGEWNDSFCQSAGEAIAVLEEAIVLAKRDLL